MPEPITSARLLIVDDEVTNIALLEGILRQAGFTSITTTDDPTEVLSLRESLDPDLILLDLNMPEVDGFEVMQQLQPWTSNGSYLPILVLTADLSKATRQKALSVGAKDFITKPLDHSEVVVRVRNLVETRVLHLELKQQNLDLEDRVRARTVDIWSAVNQLEHSQRELKSSQEETVRRLSIAAEFRDDETTGHLERMSEYCALIARLVGLDDERVQLIRVASQMHDVGKIGLPDSILSRPRALTPHERTIMRTHTEIGHQILAGSNSELLQLADTIAHTHHEWMDGSGYPNQLRGTEIPIEGRIAAIADVYDALTNDRPHRKAMTFVKGIRIMREGRGTQFDTKLLDLFLDSMDAVLTIKEEVAARSERIPLAIGGPASDCR